MGAKHKHKKCVYYRQCDPDIFFDVPMFYIIRSHTRTNVSSRSSRSNRVESLCHGVMCLLYCNSNQCMHICSNWILMHGMENVKFVSPVAVFSSTRHYPTWDTSIHGTRTQYLWIETSLLGIILWHS